MLDFTRLLPGPFATQILADLGAEVIKIEEPVMGDYIRRNALQTVDGNSIGFHAINRGKKSVALNLKEPADCAQLDKLIATADVVIESFRPGVMQKLGFAPKDLLSKYPSLIICSISGYGQSGSYKLRAGHDINYLAHAGLLGLNKRPQLPPAQIADLCGGAMPAALQVIAALYHRAKNGNRGNIIDVSMTDCSYALGVIPQAIAQNSSMAVSDGRYVLNGAVPCYNVYECADGFVAVGALEPKFWKRFCVEVMDAAHLVSKGLLMGEAAEPVKNEVTRILKTKTRAEWRTLLAKSDCCVEVVLSAEEAGKSELIRARELDVEVEIEGKNGRRQTIRVPKSPLNMLDGVRFQNAPGPSKIGQHNEEILSKL